MYNEKIEYKLRNFTAELNIKIQVRMILLDAKNESFSIPFSKTSH